MAQNLDLNVNVNTDQAGKSVGSLKTQLREAQAEVVALSDKFGATSKEAIEAAKRAGELRDRIGDASALTQAFNPDAKFRALTASLSGVAGGFAAVQGAMALFGAESEDVQKTLLKVQAAMALSQGLQSVGESIDSFKQLGAVIKSTTVFQGAYNFVMGQSSEVIKVANVELSQNIVELNTQSTATAVVATTTSAATIALRVFKAALLATGIGAIVILLTSLISSLGSFTSSTKKAKEEQDKFNESIETSNEILDNNINKIQRAGNLRISELKKNNATEAEIYKAQRKIDSELLDEYLEDYRKKYAIFEKDQIKNGKSTDEKIKENSDNFRKAALQASDKYYNQEAKLQIDANNELIRINKEAQEKKEKEEKEAQDKLQKDLLQSYEDYLKRREFARKNKEGLYKEDIRKFDQEDAEERDKKRNEEIDKNVIAQNKALANIKLNGVQILAIDQANSDAKKKITEEERNLRVNAAYDIADATMALGSIVGEQTKAGKALGVAGALINTYVGASEVIRAKSTIPEPFGTIQKIASVAAIIATGMRAVKSITAVQVPGGGGGGGVSAPAMSTQAPILPQLPAAQMTQLNAQSINDLGNQAVRAYVIETDVTGNQQRMAAIKQRARFS